VARIGRDLEEIEVAPWPREAPKETPEPSQIPQPEPVKEPEKEPVPA
jgi:hypothetical protein